MAVIAISYPPGTDWSLDPFQELASEGHELVAVHDLGPDAQEQLLRRAQILYSFNWATMKSWHQLLPELSQLQFIQIGTAGVDFLPHGQMPPEAVVCRSGGVNATAAAHHAWGMLLACARHIVRFHNALIEEKAERRMGRRLEGAVLGVLGIGAIGTEVARLGKAFQMEVVGIRNQSGSHPDCDRTVVLDQIDSILPELDALVICAPLKRPLRRLINRRRLTLMKEDAILVNIGRGKIIDEGALYDHLSRHPRFTAGIDTWWTDWPPVSPFRSRTPLQYLDNIVMTPHVATVVDGFLEEMLTTGLSNIRRFLTGEPPRFIIDPSEY